MTPTNNQTTTNHEVGNVGWQIQNKRMCKTQIFDAQIH